VTQLRPSGGPTITGSEPLKIVAGRADTPSGWEEAPVSARWIDGDDDARIDVVLRRRVLRAVFQPIVRFETGLAAAYRASVRGPLGSPLEDEGRLFAAAAHRGLADAFDDVRVQTIFDAARRARLDAPVALCVPRDPAGVLTHPLPVAGGAPIVLELDAAALTLREGAAVEAAARARAGGWRVALRNVLSGHAFGLLSAIGPELVCVGAREVADDADALGVLREQYAGGVMPLLVADGVGADHDVHRLAAAGVAFGSGHRFGRADLLLRAPVLFDQYGLAPAPVRARGD
jgi:hypothetical protein